MKTVLLSFFFVFGLACLSAQNCVETAFKFYQDSAYSPLPEHLEACLLTTLQQPFKPNIPEERHSRALALIALSNHYSTPPMLDYSRAEKTLAPVLEFLKESNQDDLPYLAEVYNLLGIYYEWLFQLDKAELYAVKSRQIAESLGDLGTMYNQDINLASLYSKTGKYAEGIEAADRGIRGMQQVMLMVEDTNVQKLCVQAILAGRFNKTVVWSEQSKQQRHNLELAAAQTSINNSLLESKMVLAQVEQLRDTSKAQLVIQQIVGTYYYSLAPDAPDSILVYVEHFLRLNNHQTSPFAIGSMTAMRGYTLGRQGHLQQALDENTRGLQGMDYPVRDAFDAPPIIVDNVSVARLLLSGIITRAEILYRFYEKDKKANLRYLRAAVALMGRDVEMTQVILRDQQTDEGIIYFQTLVLPTIDIAARYSAELYRATGEAQDFERSFSYSEQAKAFALRNKIRQIDLNVSWQGKAYECWQTELRLQDDIRRYRALADTKGVFQAQNALKNVLESWQNSSDPEIRHYYQNRYDYSTVKVQQIRSELLDDNTALISYLWMYPKPMAFVITKSHTAIYDLNIPETFMQHSQTLIQDVYPKVELLYEPYDVQCKALYDVLLGAILKDPAMVRYQAPGVLQRRHADGNTFLRFC